MAIVSLDQIVASLPGQSINLLKTGGTSRGTGWFQDLWTATGNPVAGSAPGSANGVLLNSSSQGALKFANASGIKELYLAKSSISVGSSATLIMYDRLWANSGLSGILTTPQTWTQPSLTRAASGFAVEAWLQVYTAMGTTATTATLTYTNSDGVTGRQATCTLPTSVVAGQILPFILQSGDTGVQSTSQVTLSASTGTAGNFGIVLLKRVLSTGMPVANVSTNLDAISIGMPKIEANSCVSFLILASTATIGIVIGELNIIEG